MDTTRSRWPIALLAAVSALIAMQSADAQVINRCRIDGRLVIQSSPCPLEPSAHARSMTSAPAATSSDAPKKKTLADLLRERDGGPRTQPTTREAQGDGAYILRARMGAV